MLHPRKIIRQRVVDLLKAPTAGDPITYPTGAGIYVFDSRDTEPNPDRPQQILVYTLGEKMDPEYRHQQGLRRRIMTLRIECYSIGDDGAAVADTMAWSVENAFLTDPTLNNLVEWVHLVDTNIAFAEQGEMALFCAVMDWEVSYYTNAQDDAGQQPTIVLLGFDPDTGPGHEPDYSEVVA